MALTWNPLRSRIRVFDDSLETLEVIRFCLIFEQLRNHGTETRIERYFAPAFPPLAGALTAKVYRNQASVGLPDFLFNVAVSQGGMPTRRQNPR